MVGSGEWSGGRGCVSRARAACPPPTLSALRAQGLDAQGPLRAGPAFACCRPHSYL